MKLSELIAKLEYELKLFGDGNVYIEEDKTLLLITDDDEHELLPPETLTIC